jgi:hypothetical protein
MFFMSKHCRAMTRAAKIGYRQSYNRNWKWNRRHLSTPSNEFNYSRRPDDEPDIFVYAIMGTIALYAIERYKRK